MLFIIFILFVLLLQVFHRRLLHRLLPEGADRWVTSALLLIHLPLALYVAARLTGLAGFLPWLRFLARGGVYFQLLTVMNLLLWGLSALLWRTRHGRRDPGGPEDPARRRFLRQTTALGTAFAAAGVLYGRREAFSDPEVVHLDLRFPDLPPGLDGIRIAQISDLHTGPLVKPAVVARWRALVQAERPELLLVTGDIVDSLPEEAQTVADAFRDFPAPLGRFAILGNHDYFTDPRPIWATLEAGGFRLLENRWELVRRNGDDLALVGLQDPMARHGHFRDIRFGPGPLPELAVRGLPPGTWRLCLSHRPSDWNLARKTGARLTLSGHTHGGQVNLIPGVSSALLVGPYTAGLYRKGGDALYVNRGLGVVGIPVRLGAPPEITILTLRRG
ncbi:metallophosphoesterase [Mesoterricola sediminis]|uniref:Metallophosphatase n=1 Tax=Mesoterricola sediminis TaxID=2927980 RepID=A0AA48GUC6_9BACT|nr:metallophosphoesterase [Mesoterricola sediminis]BDU75805.1 metallophosphatase [Mesoterricola sediminis]